MRGRERVERAASSDTRPAVDTRPVQQAVEPLRSSKKAHRKKLLVGMGILVAILVVVGGWFGVRFIAYEGIDTTRYQAVYLDNENVYFGKVRYMANGDLLLQDVFRVQAGEAGEGSEGKTAADIRLIKPGNELHAPDDTMRITRSKVLFIENLKSDGKVTQAITDYVKEKNAE